MAEKVENLSPSANPTSCRWLKPPHCGPAAGFLAYLAGDFCWSVPLWFSRAFHGQVFLHALEQRGHSGSSNAAQKSQEGSGGWVLGQGEDTCLLLL